MDSALTWIVDHPDWLGVGLSVVGFIATIWQIRRAASATRLASTAANSALELVRRSQFIAAASRLQKISGDIDDAVTGKEERVALLRLLNSWREEAMRVAGLYGPSQADQQTPSDLADLHKALRDSADSIEQMVEGAEDIVEATKDARRSIKKAVEPIAILGAILATGGQRSDE